MPKDSRAVTVTTTATRLDAITDNADNKSGQSIAVYNNGAATVYLGDSGVTTANGYPLGVGEHWAENLASGDELYGRVAAGTVEVRVIESGVG